MRTLPGSIAFVSAELPPSSRELLVAQAEHERLLEALLTLALAHRDILLG